LQGKSQLDSLDEQKLYIFVSRRIVGDVLRNKLKIGLQKPPAGDQPRILPDFPLRLSKGKYRAIRGRIHPPKAKQRDTGQEPKDRIPRRRRAGQFMADQAANTHRSRIIDNPATRRQRFAVRRLERQRRPRRPLRTFLVSLPHWRTGHYSSRWVMQRGQCSLTGKRQHGPRYGVYSRESRRRRFLMEGGGKAWVILQLTHGRSYVALDCYLAKSAAGKTAWFSAQDFTEGSRFFARRTGPRSPMRKFLRLTPTVTELGSLRMTGSSGLDGWRFSLLARVRHTRPNMHHMFARPARLHECGVPKPDRLPAQTRSPLRSGPSVL
jgi:hypothetical protein